MDTNLDLHTGLSLISIQPNAPDITDEDRNNIRLNLEIYTDVIKQGLDQENSIDVAQTALNHLNLILPEEFYKKLSANDFVEIYSRDGVQLFRTLNVTKLMTYSLETILTSSFEDLFERDEIYTSKIINAASQILNLKTDYIENFCPEHVVSERFGKSSVVISYKFMCALKNPFTNELAGVLVSEGIKPLS